MQHPVNASLPLQGMAHPAPFVRTNLGAIDRENDGVGRIQNQV